MLFSNPDDERFGEWLSKLDKVQENTYDRANKFNKDEHDSKSRLEITKLFLTWYFRLIAGSFAFCLLYNLSVARMNTYLSEKQLIPYVEITSAVSLITTTLSSGLGFVIGFYFKNKGE